MQIKAKDLSLLLNGTLFGDENKELTGLATIEDATENDITFISNLKYSSMLADTRAGLIIIDDESLISQKSDNQTLLKTENASKSLNELIGKYFSDPVDFNAKVSDKAHIGENVNLGENVTIEPFVFIGDNTKIGNNTIVQSGCHIAPGSIIGSGCRIYPNVSVIGKVVIGDRVIIHSASVIGSDGFGFELGAVGVAEKFLQVGKVLIGNDVEIGAGVTIDRARFTSTVIKDAVKIDNQVHIAHNVEVGEGTFLVAQVGIAGSTKLGKKVIMAGQSGAVGHINIADGVIVTSKAAVTKNIDSAKMISGFPAIDHKDFKKQSVLNRKLPELLKRVKNLEKAINKK